ncbi:MAG: CBS domain-containing protein [Cyclobacteriaceae bacterium]|nr:CBS domain-containing protein [Cyclobacteriaceae bacterium]
MIPPLKLTDTTAHALVWMDEFRCNQLPVVNNGEFMGLISEELILNNEKEVALIKEIELNCANCKVNETTHFFDILKLSASNNVELVGVVNSESKYVGVITIKDTISALSQTLAIQSNGAVLILSMKAIDYSLSEISRLVESEGYKILSSSIQKDDSNPEMVKLTLKVDSEEVGRLVATFERFNYKVIARLDDNEDPHHDQERLDILLKYLDL